jgi:hypothetical protein
MAPLSRQRGITFDDLRRSDLRGAMLAVANVNFRERDRTSAVAADLAVETTLRCFG